MYLHCVFAYGIFSNSMIKAGPFIRRVNCILVPRPYFFLRKRYRQNVPNTLTSGEHGIPTCDRLIVGLFYTPLDAKTCRRKQVFGRITKHRVYTFYIALGILLFYTHFKETSPKRAEHNNDGRTRYPYGH